MKLVKTASGKQTVKISKKEWSDIGKKAGWIKESQYNAWDDLYGSDSDDGYDAMRDFGGDIDEARRNREQADSEGLESGSTNVTPKESKFKSANLSPEDQAERQQQRADMVSALAEKLGLKTYVKGTVTGFRDGSTYQIKTIDTGTPAINASPWGEPEGYPYLSEIKRELDNGVANGKWDEYLAKQMYDEINHAFDVSIR